jgi:signal peptidase II
MAAPPRLNGKAVTAAIFLCTAAGVFAADLLTKWAAFHGDNLSRPHVIIPNFLDLTRTENRGGVFGFGQGRVTFFILFTLVASIVILWAVCRYGRASRWLTFGLACVFGGAMGNFWDRLAFGYVRDFIHCFIGRYHWPTFNVGDSAICIGAAILVIHSLFSSDGRRENPCPK